MAARGPWTSAAIRRAGRAIPRPPSLPREHPRAALRPWAWSGPAHDGRRRAEWVGPTPRSIRVRRRGGGAVMDAVGEHRPAPEVERLHALRRAPCLIGPPCRTRARPRRAASRGVPRSVGPRCRGRSAPPGACPAPKSPTDARATGVHMAAPRAKESPGHHPDRPAPPIEPDRPARASLSRRIVAEAMQAKRSSARPRVPHGGCSCSMNGAPHNGRCINSHPTNTFGLKTHVRYMPPTSRRLRDVRHGC